MKATHRINLWHHVFHDPGDWWWFSSLDIFIAPAESFGFRWWRRTHKWDAYSRHSVRFLWWEFGLYRDGDWLMVDGEEWER